MIGIRLLLDVQEYQADIYYNSKTGERVHAAFPEGVVNDVNYDGSIKAFLFLLNNECCVSIDKWRQFLSELTSGRLNISKGMINSLSKTFAEKSEAELQKAFNDMLLSPVMHVDCTNARANGESAYVFVCATPDGKTLYFGRNKKATVVSPALLLKIIRASLSIIMNQLFIIMVPIIRNALHTFSVI